MAEYLVTKAIHIGPVDEKTRLLVGGVVGNPTNLAQLERKMHFPYFVKDLVSLSRLMETAEQVGIDNFIKSPQQVLESKAEEFYTKTWVYLRGATSYLLNEQYLRSKVSGGKFIISDSQIEEAIRQAVLLDLVEADVSSFPPKVTSGKKPLLIVPPQAMAVEFISPTQAVATEYYLHRINLSPFNSAVPLKSLDTTLIDTHSRAVIKVALKHLLFGQPTNKATPLQVYLPHFDYLKPTLVTTYDTGQGLDDDFKRSFAAVVSAGLPRQNRINNIALFFLMLHTGRIPLKENWQDYFQKVI